MDIGVCSIAYSQYGKYVEPFLKSCNQMNPKPKQVTIVLGKDHGCKDIEALRLLFKNLVIVEDNGEPTMGRLRNLSVKNTPNEWILYCSVDDLIEKSAIRTFKKFQEADYICAKWSRIGLDGKTTQHSSVTPYEAYKRIKEHHKGGFIVGHSPFKRWLWEKTPYEEHDYPNSPFVLGCVRNGAKFTKSDKPTTIYIKHADSHSRTTLLLPEEKRKAIKYKRQYEMGIRDYYTNLRAKKIRRRMKLRRQV